MGFGNISFQGTQSVSPAGSGNASNGLSVNTGGNGDYVLGNAVGSLTAPAQLLNNREILDNLHTLSFIDGIFHVTSINSQSLDFFDGTNIAVHNSISSSTGRFASTIAGNTGGNQQPFLYTAGVAVQVPVVNGSKNYDGSNEYLSAGGVNYTLAKTLTATAALNFGNTAAQTSADLTIPLTGAADGDVVLLGVPIAALNANACYTAFVSAANVVTVRFNNYSAAAIDPASGTFRVSIVKY